MIDAWDFIKDNVLKVFVVAVVAIVVIAVAFLAYNARPVTGTITDKAYTPTMVVPHVQCGPNLSGDGTSCITTQRVQPESWSVTVTPDDGSSAVSRAVSESYWDQVAVGDRWTDN